MSMVEQIKSEDAARLIEEIEWREEKRRWRQQVEALAESRHLEMRRELKNRAQRIATTAAIIGAIGAIIGAAATILAARLVGN